MRCLFTFFLLITGNIIYGQCYQSIDSDTQLPFNYTTLILSGEEKEFIKFLDIDIEYWQINNENRFCYTKNLDSNPKLVLGEKTKNYISDFNISKSCIYSNIIAYYFIEKLNFDNIVESEDYKNLPHLLAGYYYCYSKIIKDWSLIKNDIKQLKLRADTLNAFLGNYVKFFDNYTNESLTEEFSEIEIKRAFLEGTYYAMPPDYRMHVNSDKIIGNNIELLFKEAILIVAKKSNTRAILKNQVTEEDLIFKIKKTKR